jgi:hypothetical protein
MATRCRISLCYVVLWSCIPHVQGVWVRSTFFYAVGASCSRMVEAEGVIDHHGRLEESEHLTALALVSLHLPLYPAPGCAVPRLLGRSNDAVMQYNSL